MSQVLQKIAAALAARGRGILAADETVPTLAGVSARSASRPQSKGAKRLPGLPDETVTEGLDGPRNRLAEYRGRRGWQDG